jgi:hypothetical protein
MFEPTNVVCPRCHAVTTRGDTLVTCTVLDHTQASFYLRQCPDCECKFDFDADRIGMISRMEIVFPDRVQETAQAG